VLLAYTNKYKLTLLNLTSLLKIGKCASSRRLIFTTEMTSDGAHVAFNVDLKNKQMNGTDMKKKKKKKEKKVKDLIVL